VRNVRTFIPIDTSRTIAGDAHRPGTAGGHVRGVEMTTSVRLSRAAWPVFVLVAGMILGLGGPAAIGAVSPRATKAAVQSRSFSCPALAFHPADAQTSWSYETLGIYRTDSSADSRTGFFICNAVLPTRAVVTKVQFTLYDNTSSGQIRYCGLYRHAISATSTVVKAEELAATRSSDKTGNKRPGYELVADGTIKHATIDNRYGYWLQCRIDKDKGTLLRLFGANVIYTISAANG
jgi:hypothetical protein